MTRRHEKMKPHLIEQYERQGCRLLQCAIDNTIALNCKPTVTGTIFSDRFKK